MYFLNRGNSRFSLLVIVILIFLLINFLPYILLIGAVIWILSYAYKKIKQFDFKNGSKVKMKKSSFNKGEEDDFKSFNNSNVIDVDYTDVK